MITKKISKEMEEKLLKLIYQRYTQEYGYGTRKLDAYTVSANDGEVFRDEMPEIVEYDPNQNMKSSLLPHILKELLAKGYVELPTDVLNYRLTVRGYEHASKNKFEHLITYLNNNSGWAIPLALLSLIVSIIALFVG